MSKEESADWNQLSAAEEPASPPGTGNTSTDTPPPATPLPRQQHFQPLPPGTHQQQGGPSTHLPDQVTGVPPLTRQQPIMSSQQPAFEPNSHLYDPNMIYTNSLQAHPLNWPLSKQSIQHHIDNLPLLEIVKTDLRFHVREVMEATELKYGHTNPQESAQSKKAKED